MEFPDPMRQRMEIIVAGFRADPGVARSGLADPEPVVRASALSALARLGALGDDELLRGLRDGDAGVRRRSCEIAAQGGPGALIDAALEECLHDHEPLVVDAACWSVGERMVAVALDTLVTVATEHRDPRCREAAVAALGALGDDRGLPAVMAALDDKPAIRRRAVVALSAFDGPEVEAAIERAREDRDWQVRAAADELGEL